MRYQILDLFTQTKDTDPDLRFMALNDLEKETVNAPDSFQQSEKNDLSNILLHCLDDETPAVRTQALKNYESFAPIMGSLSTSVISTLVKKKPEKVSITSSIYTMAIHNIIKNLSHGDGTGKDIVKVSLHQIFSNSDQFYKTIDYIEVLSDLLEFLGSDFSMAQLTNTAELLIDASYKADAVISKKSIVSLNVLARSISSQDQLNQVVEKIASNTSASNSTKTQLTTFGILTNLIKGNPYLMSTLVHDLWNTVIQGLKLDSLQSPDDDFDIQQEIEEVRAESLGCISAMIENFPTDVMENYINDVLETTSRFIAYDPYNDDDDDASIDEQDSEMDEDEDEDEMSDYLDDDDDEDSSGLSWKLRREAPRLISTVLGKYPRALIGIYKTVFDSLINQLKDTNSHVVSELLKTLTKVFKYSTKEGPYYSLKSFKYLSDIAAGRRGSDVSMVVEDDPFAMLLSKSDNVNHSIDTLLVPKYSSELPLLGNFVVELSNAMEGFEGNWIEIFTSKLSELKESETITSDQIKFYSSILAKNSLETLGSSSQIVLADVLKCFNSSKNHELVLETIALVNSLFTTYIPAVPSDESILQFSETAGDELIRKITGKAYSLEIRQRSLICLSSLLLNVRVPTSKQADFLQVLAEVITIEFLIQNDLSCIEKLVKSKISFPITSEWTKSLIKPISEYATDKDQQTQALSTLLAILDAGLLDQSDKEELIIPLLHNVETCKLSVANKNTYALVLAGLVQTIDVSSELSSIVKLLVIFSSDAKFDQDALVALTQAILVHTSSEKFINILLKNGKQSDANISKILAIISVYSKKFDSISEILQDLNNGKQALFSIIFLEQVSKSMDLDCGLEPFFQYFDSADDEIKRASVNAVATVVSSNINKYLSIFLQYLGSTSNRVQSLQCLNNVLKHVTIDPDYSTQIFELVVNLEQSNSDISTLHEAEYTAAGEILNKLALSNSALLNDYIGILKNSGSSLPVKVAIGASVKHFYEYEEFVTDNNSHLNTLLDLSSVDGFLFDHNLTLKQVGVNNLLFVTHKKPLIALPLISRALPTILTDELAQKKEYVKVLKIGPFKHKIDDALNFRRSLYELIYTLITSLENNQTLLTLGHIDWNDVFKAFTVRSLKDDLTIIFTSLLTLLKIANLKPTIFQDSEVLTTFIQSCTKLLNKKMKEDPTKQEIAKREDTDNAVLRCCKKMDVLVQKGTLKMDREGESQWREFTKELRQKHGKFDAEE